eukprot:TRINITY_DN7686_c0_g1_i1.p1 TRINITY_DN7686_c0_g1~~TRINITY_DN7686_c0_g1_i1.p1  ORF type:complete len:545 (-),score=221.95 TRINITY_DN7686_c0_g1_i1:368-2002(-)
MGGPAKQQKTKEKVERPTRKSSQQSISYFLNRVSSDEDADSKENEDDSDEDFISDRKRPKNSSKLNANKEKTTANSNSPQKPKEGRVKFELPSFLFKSTSVERPPAYISMNDTIEEEESMDGMSNSASNSAQSISSRDNPIVIMKESVVQNESPLIPPLNEINSNKLINAEPVYNSKFALEITEAKPYGKMAKKHTMEVETINPNSMAKNPKKAIKSSMKANKKEPERKDLEKKEVKKCESSNDETNHNNNQKTKKENIQKRTSPFFPINHQNGSNNSKVKKTKKRDNTSLNKWVIRKTTEFPDACDSDGLDYDSKFSVHSEAKNYSSSSSVGPKVEEKKERALVIQISDGEDSDDFDISRKPQPSIVTRSPLINIEMEQDNDEIEVEREEDKSESEEVEQEIVKEIEIDYPSPSPKDRRLEVTSSTEVQKPPKKKLKKITGLFIHTFDELVTEAKVILTNSAMLSQYKSSHSEGDREVEEEEDEEEFRLDQTQEVMETKRQRLQQHLNTIERAKLTIINAQKAMEEAARKTMRMLGYDDDEGE